jgi:hypothetical protein
MGESRHLRSDSLDGFTSIREIAGFISLKTKRPIFFRLPILSLARRPGHLAIAA